ncbi:MAG TPA: sulfite dehydrogenase [Rhodocyclaceae bacterium]|uniref:sulfite dehydrogenase n=1 Tax=Zoogloea sp. TaxID=49181 RepID=UPI002B837A10|nr:sulfite dehydrogenase [Zoogloea sp.]HMV62191.1 sulfite dehydrogenase [Rhodocyclaceae bacterium]HMW51839.1 sulfite dehydrogenase [Rhodocyclaceae bacterium]HMY49972.1 sulfite dehydrogenase [Rhodocyclaceae bacterium]HNA67168.1 sulfite dehydrogenase [Rhodocyclaceae bacterium]HNB65639.1 sulfite dehydrogenase [Rhodocyclaceae bacterium]
MAEQPIQRGRLRPAPEHFLNEADVQAVEAGRRGFLRKALVTASAAMAATTVARAEDGDPAILTLPPWTTSLGQPVAARPYGLPSQYEKGLQRRESPGLTRMSQVSVAFTPLQGLFGIVTPSGLHFERHHQGWSDIDPSKHRLMINASDDGFIRAPRVYTVDDILRLPPVSRMHFIECGANTGMEWGNVAVPTVQYTHGMLSCSEFTGVPLRTLLDDCGVNWKKARYVLAEGADGSSMTRTIPIELVESGEVLVAYGQNGEMLRPENGYPLRLVVPGVQGVSWVKWLRRIEVGDQPWATKDEAIHYVDLLPGGQHRQYTSIQECKSVITTPSGGQMLLDKGFYNISGLAWSGRGKITRVDVSTDGGVNWRSARIDGPVHGKCLTRFNIDWVWDGRPAILQSRAVDDTGYVQPRYGQLRAVRGTKSIYHNNAIQSWKVAETGEVSNVQVL